MKLLLAVLAFLGVQLLLSSQLNASVQEVPGESIVIKENSWITQVAEDIVVISSNEKNYQLLLMTRKLNPETQYANVQALNKKIEEIEGVMQCSYSWNNGVYKLTVQKEMAMKVLHEEFLFDMDFIESKISG